ncbi:glycosyltransferase family 39 protein [Guyparkeria hydrothermalis]|uniref:ArnT family glycosyltransferase n=1 Tax=Guyparkeria hydrothermalis TaxID=923 RepID=UPI002022902F|nr:glycosyltransferase family 39 protein [Guyparkeria hydrothermalis]MCL7744197.1 glycosyltransferase family 39 protein [Guyparkeria hydrothermalis]
MSVNGLWYRVLEWGWLPLFVLLVAVSLLTRPLMPIDETRYLGVAWEMWHSGSWIVPLLNGEPYSHKPPLLFWLIHAGWAAFGVNEITPRLLGPLFAFGSLFLIRAVASRLFPERPIRAALAPWVLLGTIYWLGFATMVMFDQLVVFFVLLGVFGLLEVGRGRRRGWVWLFLGTAFGTLAKGPFALIYLVPLTVAAPWWAGVGLSWAWFVRAGLVGFLGSCVALLWALWAANLGGPEYAESILWGQMAGRAVNAFDHAQPIYYYLWVLPLLFLPWSLLLGRVHLVIARRSADGRHLIWLLIAWVGAPFLLLSLASGKLPHYLLPMIPALAVMVTVLLDDAIDSDRLLRLRSAALLWIGVGLALAVLPWISGHVLFEMLPGWVAGLGAAMMAMGGWLWRARRADRQVVALSTATVIGLLLGHLAMAPLRPAFDLQPFAVQIGEWQHAGRPIAFIGKYRDEFHFHGRLKRPVVVLGNEAAVRDFCAGSPKGLVVERWRGSVPAEAIASTRFRSKYDVAFPCSALMAAEGMP